MFPKDKQQDNDKRAIKNWRTISLLDVEYEIALKTFSERLRKLLPVLISHKQRANVKDSFICKILISSKIMFLILIFFKDNRL